MGKLLFSFMILLILLVEIMAILSPIASFLLNLGLISLVVLLFARRDSNYEDLILPIMCLLLIRIIESFITLPAYGHILLVHFTLFIVSIYYILQYSIHFRFRYWRLFPLVILLGGLLGLLGNAFFEKLSPNFLLLFPLISVSEELFFRGLLQEKFEKMGILSSILIPSFIYAIFSLNLGVFAFFYFFFISFFIGVVYYSTKNLFFSFCLNLLISILVFILPKLVL